MTGSARLGGDCDWPSTATRIAALRDRLRVAQRR